MSILLATLHSVASRHSQNKDSERGYAASVVEFRTDIIKILNHGALQVEVWMPKIRETGKGDPHRRRRFIEECEIQPHITVSMNNMPLQSLSRYYTYLHRSCTIKHILLMVVVGKHFWSCLFPAHHPLSVMNANTQTLYIQNIAHT